MAQRPQRPQRSAGRKQADVIADGMGRTVARTPGRGLRSVSKDAPTDKSLVRKISKGRGRPAVFTREEILETAKVAFSKTGYANVTLDDLAALLNTGKGTLYYHSNRKVDLLIAISTTAVGDCRLTRCQSLRISQCSACWPVRTCGEFPNPRTNPICRKQNSIRMDHQTLRYRTPSAISES